MRPCMIHGPGNKGNLNLLYNVVKKGIPWPLGSFENRRSFTSIDNLCYVVEGLLVKNAASGIYHMGDDEALSTNELIAIMCEVMGKQPHIWKMNKRFMEVLKDVNHKLEFDCPGPSIFPLTLRLFRNSFWAASSQPKTS